MVDNPITRKEKYLAKLTGSYTGNIPDPITRVEKYLYDLCQKGISGLTPEEIENAVNKYLEGKDYVTKTDADKAYQPAGSYLSGTDEGLAVSGKAADAKAVGNAVAKIEGINYTDRGTLADTDAFLINDSTGMKKSVLSKLSDFVLDKIADKVFEKLQTNDKTILGAINELNSKTFKGSISLISYDNGESYVTAVFSINPSQSCDPCAINIANRVCVFFLNGYIPKLLGFSMTSNVRECFFSGNGVTNITLTIKFGKDNYLSEDQCKTATVMSYIIK